MQSQAEDRDQLANFVTELRFQSPSIISRFETWAAQAALPGWAQDVAAFKQFQKMRNSLVHAGRKGFEPRVTVGKKDVRTLEDITERYVSLALFGDANIYQSRKRPTLQKTE
jgi:predicted fused transcriptional regulator/phosphomethylpyrimidine kinase